MKQYKHKPTGLKVQQVGGSWNNKWYIELEAGGQMYFADIIEKGQDWEEIKPEPDVPPGILSFKDKDHNNLHRMDLCSPYDIWVAFYQKQGCTIHSIRVGDEVWTVGDLIKIDGRLLVYCIESFKWHDGFKSWWCMLDDYGEISMSGGIRHLGQPTLESRVKAIEDFLSNFKK